MLFADGTEYQAEVLGTDPTSDLAVLKINPLTKPLTALRVGDSSTLRVGQLVVAIGNPFGQEFTMTSGIVSALGRTILSGPTSFATSRVIQTDAPINPGNSGGPLADRNGHVIGMNTSIRTEGFLSANVGVGFAIPSDTVLLVAQRLISGEPIGTAFLGILGETPTDGRAGALIIEVQESSPAHKAGLEVGDLIIRVDRRPILNMQALRADIQLRLPGDEVTLEYIRGEKISEAIVRLASLDDEYQ